MRQSIQIACWKESRWKVVLEFLILKLANMWGRGVGIKRLFCGSYEIGEDCQPEERRENPG